MCHHTYLFKESNILAGQTEAVSSTQILAWLYNVHAR